MPTTRNALKAGAYTALWTFLALFGAAALGFLTQVGQWASAHGRDPFPDVSVLGYAFIAAVVAALAGILGTIIRLAQAHGLVPGQPPGYEPTSTPGGDYTADEVQAFMDQAHRAGRAKRAKPKLVDQAGQVTVGGLLIVLVLVILLLVVLGAI